MNDEKVSAGENPALLVAIIFGGPKGMIISSSTKIMTSSAVVFLVILSMGQLVKCFTQMRMYIFSLTTTLAMGPAKLVENVSETPVIGLEKLLS